MKMLDQLAEEYRVCNRAVAALRQQVSEAEEEVKAIKKRLDSAVDRRADAAALLTEAIGPEFFAAMSWAGVKGRE